MSGLSAVLVAAILGTPSPETSIDWNIWLFKSSGWGGRSGIFIDSTGRNVAFVDPLGHEQQRNLMEDLRRGAPSSFCESLPLSDYQVRKFAFRIESIPEDVIAKGSLSITGMCADEPRIGVILTTPSQQMHFNYSLEKSCRNGQVVPDWLIGLVNALWARYHEIKACSATSLTTTTIQ